MKKIPQPETMTFRNQLDALSMKFVGDYRRRDAAACSEAFNEDGSLLAAGAPPFRGRREVAAAFQAAMDSGQEVFELITTEADADERFGYAIQTVRTSTGNETVLVAMRCDDDGIWRVACEAVVGT